MDYCTEDKFTFIEEIKSVSLNNTSFVSYDVTSLFTYIPLKGTIELALTVLLENEANLRIYKNGLKKLFKIATCETHFMLKSKFYDQIDGVAMGSSLVLVLANLFMVYHEKTWLSDCPNIVYFSTIAMLMIFLQSLIYAMRLCPFLNTLILDMQT